MFRKIVVTMMSLCLVPMLVVVGQDRMTSEELLDCVQVNWNPDSYHATTEIRSFHPDFSREFKLEIWTSSNNDHAMIRVLEPSDESGSGYLLLGEDELWFYSPEAGQAISLPSSALGQAFFGSDIAVEDLYRGTIDESYTATLLGTQQISEDVFVHRLRLVPLEDAAVVYGKLELDVIDSNCAVTRIDFYDQRETLIREALFEDFVEENGIVLPLKTTINDLLEDGSFTEEEILSFEIGVEIPEARFTLECLEDESQCG